MYVNIPWQQCNIIARFNGDYVPLATKEDHACMHLVKALS